MDLAVGKNFFISKKNIRVNLLNILVLKILPIIPFSWVNIFVSSTKFNATKYLLINMIGCVPNILLFTNLGKNIFETNIINILFIGVLYLILILIGAIYMNFFLKNSE